MPTAHPGHSKCCEHEPPTFPTSLESGAKFPTNISYVTVPPCMLGPGPDIMFDTRQLLVTVILPMSQNKMDIITGFCFPAKFI